MFFNFDPNDGECSARFTNDASCPERLDEHSFFHWYQIIQEVGDSEINDGSDTTQPESLATLIQGGQFCKAEAESLGFGLSVEDCAAAVIQRAGQFFLRDQSDGECRHSYASSQECTEGLEEHPNWEFY